MGNANAFSLFGNLIQGYKQGAMQNQALKPQKAQGLMEMAQHNAQFINESATEEQRAQAWKQVQDS